ncbi:AMP-binding protein [Tolypothrix bouteillei VB521301_2]
MEYDSTLCAQLLLRRWLPITPAISYWLTDSLDDCTLHNHYGPSESHVVTTYTLTDSVESWPLLPPIGRPIANTQIYILDGISAAGARRCTRRDIPSVEWRWRGAISTDRS